LTMGTTNITVTDTNLAVNATNSGAVSPASGWYDAGTNVTISAIAPYSNNFAGWLGDGNGSVSNTANPAVITMNGPIREIASFCPGCRQLRWIVLRHKCRSLRKLRLPFGHDHRARQTERETDVGWQNLFVFRAAFLARHADGAGCALRLASRQCYHPGGSDRS